MDSTIRGIIDNVAAKHGRTEKEVEEIYLGMFAFIREKIDNLDFNKLNTEEDFRKAKTNFNIPRILKLYTTPKRVEYVKTKIGEINPPDVQRSRSNDHAEGRGEEGERTDSPDRSGTE